MKKTLDEETILPFFNFKEKEKESVLSCPYKQYLSLLGPNQIMRETQQLLKALEDQEFNEELKKRAFNLLQELQERLQMPLGYLKSQENETPLTGLHLISKFKEE